MALEILDMCKNSCGSVFFFNFNHASSFAHTTGPGGGAWRRGSASAWGGRAAPGSCPPRPPAARRNSYGVTEGSWGGSVSRENSDLRPLGPRDSPPHLPRTANGRCPTVGCLREVGWGAPESERPGIRVLLWIAPRELQSESGVGPRGGGLAVHNGSLDSSITERLGPLFSLGLSTSSCPTLPPATPQYFYKLIH